MKSILVTVLCILSSCVTIYASDWFEFKPWLWLEDPSLLSTRQINITEIFKKGYFHNVLSLEAESQVPQLLWVPTNASKLVKIIRSCCSEELNDEYILNENDKCISQINQVKTEYEPLSACGPGREHVLFNQSIYTYVKYLEMCQTNHTDIYICLPKVFVLVDILYWLLFLIAFSLVIYTAVTVLAITKHAFNLLYYLIHLVIYMSVSNVQNLQHYDFDEKVLFFSDTLYMLITIRTIAGLGWVVLYVQECCTNDICHKKINQEQVEKSFSLSIFLEFVFSILAYFYYEKTNEYLPIILKLVFALLFLYFMFKLVYKLHDWQVTYYLAIILSSYVSICFEMPIVFNVLFLIVFFINLKFVSTHNDAETKAKIVKVKHMKVPKVKQTRL